MSTETAPTASPSEEPGDAPSDSTDDTTDVTPARPLTAALLNLSGLGLGYLHLRAWLRLVVALAATAALAWLALPIEREPIAVWWALGYLGALGLFALDAALLARRRTRRETPRRTVWAPRAAGRVGWATLAVVPILALAYVVTQHEVLEQHLAYDLDRAEQSLDGMPSAFASYKEPYDVAYATYLRTAAEHPETRAAGRVPGLIDDLYARAKGTEVCNTLTAVRHFAEPGTPGPLRSVAESELPGALHGCGMQFVEDGELRAAQRPLTELMADHPASEPAAALPDDLASWRDGLIKRLAQKNGCTDTAAVTGSTGFLAGFDSGTLSALADKTRKRVPAGLLECAVRQFEAEDHFAAEANLKGLLDSYPRAKEAKYAERLQIASAIARLSPESGVTFPPRSEPAGSVTLTIYNYSPDQFEMVYTGPATGVVTIDPCENCTYYAKGDQPECSGYSLTIPSQTVVLPAGDYTTATRQDGVVIPWQGGDADEASYTTDSWLCTWNYER
ncbi:hypothetical protein [Promicromonospora iranensis]|uniref:Uncharacterized protein n=1 Tax=Promicromonospora iranensis TaxID=1105144 RepID=A0ABU2CVB5_9MICO|nr:hypothetical protein [Promicromonospora iranensis]MDR7385281.1 hypothetical protein [Promicromonospora iranensis]